MKKRLIQLLRKDLVKEMEEEKEKESGVERSRMFNPYLESEEEDDDELLLLELGALDGCSQVFLSLFRLERLVRLR